MSFDTVFNYSDALATMDATIATQNATIAQLDTQIADVQSLPSSYDEVKNPKLDSLNGLKDYEIQARDNAQSVKDEILALNALSEGDKQTLYNYWQLTGEAKRSWMQRMMYNRSGTLIAEAAALLADNSLDTPAKQQLAACLTCEKHSIHRNSYLVFRQLPE